MDDYFCSDEWFRDIRKGHERKEHEFEKLSLDPPAKCAAVGDRVLVAAGLLGMGFEWIRLEATVIEVADTSYRVRFSDRKDYATGAMLVQWVHRNIVTDVLGSEN